MDELKRLIETSAADTRPHFDMVAEQLRSDVHIGIEASSSASEKVDRLGLTIREEFAETKSMIRLSHVELDRRLRTLEGIVASLQSRLERLEGDVSTHS